jgi:hypothetical protein
MRRGVLGELEHDFEQLAKTKLKHPMLFDSESLPIKEESPVTV